MRCYKCNNIITPQENYPLTKKEGNNSGQQLWAKLFSKVPNIRLVICGNGGDGWLRILEFMPDGKTIKVRTYSPLFGISNLTKHLAYRTADYDQFDFMID